MRNRDVSAIAAVALGMTLALTLAQGCGGGPVSPDVPNPDTADRDPGVAFARPAPEAGLALLGLLAREGGTS